MLTVLYLNVILVLSGLKLLLQGGLLVTSDGPSIRVSLKGLFKVVIVYLNQVFLALEVRLNVLNLGMAAGFD